MQPCGKIFSSEKITLNEEFINFRYALSHHGLFRMGLTLTNPVFGCNKNF